MKIVDFHCSHAFLRVIAILVTKSAVIFNRTLGNYAFLTKAAQSKALNKDFPSKKDVYEHDTDMKLTQELASVENWTPDTINQRQEKMTNIWVKSISF